MMRMHHPLAVSIRFGRFGLKGFSLLFDDSLVLLVFRYLFLIKRLFAFRRHIGGKLH
ncbi:hypothetical protein GALL_538830 [mine drainage metagenome]|uniref:Uncharacterized protein n=1 Tax=mine drainage metagenome TaxID=410659 RepID=A0A1J5P0F3_9ZZZZ